jgi:hypothetical protein
MTYTHHFGFCFLLFILEWLVNLPHITQTVRDEARTQTHQYIYFHPTLMPLLDHILSQILVFGKCVEHLLCASHILVLEDRMVYQTGIAPS